MQDVTRQNITEERQNEFFQRGIMVDPSIPPKEVIGLINFIHCNYEPVELIRIGGLNDGGYLFPDIFADIDYCFSPGVSYSASFEEHLANEYNIQSFLEDLLTLTQNSKG